MASLLTFGCRASIDPFGDTPAMARYAADHAFAGFAFRFYNVHRDSQFNRARSLMGQYALIPARLYRDSSLWNARSDSARTLFVRGRFEDSHYLFAADPQAPYPRALGDERHALNLRWLGGGDYEWYLTVDHAIGPATPAAIGTSILATLTAAEGRTSADALADAAGAFPRTGRHLAQLFDLDSLRTTVTGGSTAVTLGLSLRPDRLRTRYPFFAGYVDRYVMPTVYTLRLADRAGHSFLELEGSDGRVVVRLRSRDHRLVSLGEPVVPMPDSLRLHADLSMKYGVFRIGFTDLVGDFTIERGQQDRAWVMRFREEPAWHFPLAVDKLIQNPLHRPFEGRGIEFRLGLRSDLGPQTVSVRHTRLTVNESAIMRWLGRLGANAFGEFSGRTELEENLFLYELFAALREDIAP